MTYLSRVALRPVAVVLPVALALAACETPQTAARSADWRAILAAEAPPGSPASAAEAALRKRGLIPQRGTYTTVRDDGTQVPNCPDPKAALTASEAGGRIGFNSEVIEITTCLDARGRVASHKVGVWIQ